VLGPDTSRAAAFTSPMVPVCSRKSADSPDNDFRLVCSSSQQANAEHYGRRLALLGCGVCRHTRMLCYSAALNTCRRLRV
jgi:hypothetical protein